MAKVHLAYDDAVHTPSASDVWVVAAGGGGLAEPVASGTFGGGGGGGATELDGLSDVTLTTETTGDLIRYNGSQWVNYPDSNYAASGHNHSGTYVETSDVGSANGVASLDGSGKVPTAQLPALALTDVHVVADITARDALTVQEGDVAIVTDAGSGDPASYIYDGTSWQELEATDHTHDIYLTQAEGDALYETINAVSDHEAAGDPHSQYLTETEANGLYVTQSGHGEVVEDIVGGMLTGNTETLITVTYQDADGTIDFVVNNDLSAYSNASTNFQSLAGVQTEIDTRVDKAFVDALNVDADTLDGVDSTGFATASHNHSGTYAPVSHTHTSTDVTDFGEAVSDQVGTMVTGNTETLITVTYDDVDNTLDFVVNNDLSAYSNTTSDFQNTTGVNSLIDTRVDKAFVDALNVDADTVDGQHASAFASASHNHTSSDVTDFAEAVSDQVGAMVTGNTETGITVTYQDADNTLDFAVAYGTVTGLTAGGSSSNGSGSTAARANHVHGLSAAAAVGLSDSSTNTEGSASTIARSDHTHAVSGFATTGHTHSAYVAKTGDTMTGDLEFSDIGEGVILRSPDGSRWRVTIDNTGNVISTGL